MRILVLGATGLLGKYILREWTTDAVTGYGSKDVDIRDESQVQRLIGLSKPDWTILAAAYTDVDGCELNPQLAFAINFQGAVNVATAARDHGSQLMFISTDYVFDGTQSLPYDSDSSRNPQSIYGRSKAEAELALQQLLPDSCIVRTSWVFGTGGKCFPETILHLAASRPELRVVDDQRGCPTYTRDLARTIIQLAHKTAKGIVHATNTGDCTWFEFASEIVRQAVLPVTLYPTTTDQFPRPAKRPAYSVLSPRTLRHYGITMPTWQEALREFLQERELQRRIVPVKIADP